MKFFKGRQQKAGPVKRENSLAQDCVLEDCYMLWYFSPLHT